MLSLDILEEIVKDLKFKAPTDNTIKANRDWDFMEPQLDLHMQTTLKIGFNLKDLTLNQNVKEFFLSRFKKQLIEKNSVDSIQQELTSKIRSTRLQLR